MPPAGGHPTVLDEHDGVGAVEQQRARGDQHRGAPGPVRHQPLGDPRLGVGVDRARRLDEHEHLGVAQQGAGQGDPLALPTRQCPAALLELAVHPVLERVEGVGGAGDPHGGVALLVARPAQGLAHRPAEQVRVGLGHHDARAHGIHRQVVEGDRTPAHAVPAGPGAARAGGPARRSPPGGR